MSELNQKTENFLNKVISSSKKTTLFEISETDKNYNKDDKIDYLLKKVDGLEKIIEKMYKENYLLPKKANGEDIYIHFNETVLGGKITKIK